MLESKAAQYINRSIEIISRWEPTSQTSTDCGFRWGKLALSVRSVRRINCGAEHDRDRNAAKNIDNVEAGLAYDAKRTPRGLANSRLPFERLGNSWTSRSFSVYDQRPSFGMASSVYRQ